MADRSFKPSPSYTKLSETNAYCNLSYKQIHEELKRGSESILQMSCCRQWLELPHILQHQGLEDGHL